MAGSLLQKIYADFSGGFNDSVAAISIKDNEVCVSENADYSAEIQSFKTRKGCSKVNTASLSGEVSDIHTWSIGSKYKKCYVKGSKLYDFNEATQTSTEKITLSSGADKIYPFSIYNKFYFGDGNELYSWGDFDLTSDAGTVSVSANKIVKNIDNSSTGTLGHFYKALNNRGSINLKTENYSNTSNWQDVTEAPYFASSVVRVLEPHDPSQPEKARITVAQGSTTAGDITIHLGGTANTVTLTANMSISDIVSAIHAITVTGWASVIESNSVIFTKLTNELTENGYVDPGSTGCILTYVTLQEGKSNDNDLAPIKKCTMFVVHSASYRLFACGNPDDNALFYSEIGNITYFKKDINKVYASNSFGKPTALKELSESIIISYENGWYRWEGVSPLEDATWKPLNIPYGCVADRTLVLTPYSFMFLSRDGIYNVSVSILNSSLVLLQGSSVIKKITQSKVDNAIAEINDMSKCQAVFHDNVYYLAYNTDGAKNDKVLKYEWDTDSFTTVTGWQVNAWADDGIELYFASKNYLLKANDTYSDVNLETGEDEPISLYIKTKEYHFGNPFVNKVVRLIGFIFKQYEDSNDEVSADIKVLMGYNSFEINTIDINESLVWGRDWGLLWGFREAITKMVELIEQSNTFQLEIRNSTLNSPMTLVAIGFVYEQATDFITPTLLKDEDLLQ